MNTLRILLCITRVLQRYLGLVSGSLKGSYNGSHISCSFGHQLEIDPHNPESSYVSNLTSPHYVIFARGSADGAGKTFILTLSAFVKLLCVFYIFRFI